MANIAKRIADLRQMLSERRQELQEEVQSRLREGRASLSNDVRDAGEESDNLHQSDIGFSMLQMRADMLTHIDEALARLDEGHYGNCIACDKEIAELRLRALPFAVRCRACEALHEKSKLRANQLADGLSAPDEVVRAGRRSARAEA